jgi:hypothetical protein
MMINDHILYNSPYDLSAYVDNRSTYADNRSTYADSHSTYVDYRSAYMDNLSVQTNRLSVQTDYHSAYMDYHSVQTDSRSVQTDSHSVQTDKRSVQTDYLEMKNKKRIMVRVMRFLTALPMINFRFLTAFGMTSVVRCWGRELAGRRSRPANSLLFFSHRRRACFDRREKSPNAVRHLSLYFSFPKKQFTSCLFFIPYPYIIHQKIIHNL